MNTDLADVEMFMMFTDVERCDDGCLTLNRRFRKMPFSHTLSYALLPRYVVRITHHRTSGVQHPAQCTHTAPCSEITFLQRNVELTLIATPSHDYHGYFLPSLR